MTDYYWHFCAVDADGVPRLGHGDGREVRVGETLTVDGVIELCEHGLHASERILDALKYASSRSALCRVTLGGTIVRDTDKYVAAERTVVAMLSAAETDALLREFARWCALQVIDLWDAPQVVRDYLETDDESIRDAARAAAWDAASAAAWDAASAAARPPASGAARSAAWAAAWDAAWGAARDAQNEWLAAAALRRYVPDWRTRLAMWLAWHMPREIVYWCAVRVVTHASTAPDGALTAVQALEAWEEVMS